MSRPLGRRGRLERNGDEAAGDLLKVAREQTRRKHGCRVACRGARIRMRGPAARRLPSARGAGLPDGGGSGRAGHLPRGAAAKTRGYGFGTGRRGSFDAGQPERFTARDAGRYISKYLRPDGAKTSFVPLLEASTGSRQRDPKTGRLKVLVRPVYVSTTLTRRTGVTMGFLRFKRWVWVEWGDGATEEELRSLYRRHRELSAQARERRRLAFAAAP